MSLSRLFNSKVVLSQSLVSAVYLVLAGLAIILHAPVANAWQDALSDSEISLALELADLTININPPVPIDAGKTGNATLHQTSTHPLGTQLLIVELKEQKKTVSDQRLAEIFTYNYSSQLAQRHIVDLQQSVLVSVQNINSAHLPLSDVEIGYANSKLWNNTEFRQRVLQEMSDLQLNPSSVLISQTDARVSVWVPGSVEQGASSGCQLQRCALFSLYTDSQDSLTIEPVVNLVTGAVYADLPK